MRVAPAPPLVDQQHAVAAGVSGSAAGMSEWSCIFAAEWMRGPHSPW